MENNTGNIESKPNQIEALLGVNTDKMNFQQDMCFRMQNWAIAINGGLLSVIWGIGKDCSFNIYFLIINIVLIVFLIYLILERRNWMYYFFVFRERANLCENTLIVDQPEYSDFAKEYYKFIAVNEIFPDKKKIEKFKKEKKERNTIKGILVYYVMILINVISMVIWSILGNGSITQ